MGNFKFIFTKKLLKKHAFADSLNSYINTFKCKKNKMNFCKT
jgi:hypothetical protein